MELENASRPGASAALQDRPQGNVYDLIVTRTRQMAPAHIVGPSFRSLLEPNINGEQQQPSSLSAALRGRGREVSLRLIIGSADRETNKKGSLGEAVRRWWPAFLLQGLLIIIIIIKE